jgi:Ubiquitin carboxyl-terminal hydrolase
MSAILHCLIHCVPLQEYFVRDVGHHHAACNIYRTMNAKSAAQNSRDSSAKAKAKMKNVCLACEMDRLFLRYIGSATGIDLLSIVDTSPSYPSPKEHEKDRTIWNSKKECVVVKGSPLLTAEMLAAAWKCGGMNHLAGYEQRDAHEFLHGFLEALGKHMRQFRDHVRTTICSIQPSSSIEKVNGKAKNGACRILLPQFSSMLANVFSSLYIFR